MHVAFLIISVLLALEMAATGAPKVLQLSAVRASAQHLGVSVTLDRMIGAAQLAATIGLLVGIADPTLSVVTGAAVVLMMCGAISYHVKAGDKVSAMAPAVLTATLAIAVAVLAAATPVASLPNL